MENVAFWFWAPYLPSPKRTESCSLVSPFEIGWLIYSCFSPSCMRRNRGCEISPCFLLPISFEPIAPVFPPLLSLSLSLSPLPLSPKAHSSHLFLSQGQVVFFWNGGIFISQWLQRLSGFMALVMRTNYVCFQSAVHFYPLRYPTSLTFIMSKTIIPHQCPDVALVGCWPVIERFLWSPSLVSGEIIVSRNFPAREVTITHYYSWDSFLRTWSENE